MSRLLVVLLALAAAAPAQTIEQELARAMELNRSGSWTEAAAVADAVAAREGLTETQRARALFSAAYGHLRSGKRDQAKRRLADLEPLLAHFSGDHWVARESAALKADLAAARPEPAVEEDGSWQPADDAHGQRMAATIAAFEGIAREGGADAFLLAQDGRILTEWQSERYELPMHAMSSTKSVTAILVGMLIDDGKIDGLDQRVGEFLPDWRGGEKGTVTVGHLLSHTAGFENRARRGEVGVGNESDKNVYVRALELDWPPGERFSYSNEGAQLLSPILDAAAGEPVQDYAARRLFAPLGMTRSRLKLDQQGHAWTYADMETTPRDLARIGLLMLNGGTWRGRRIVSEEWIRRATRPSQELEPGCGLLWWLFAGGFAAQGYLGTDVHVFPRGRLVAVRMQRQPGPDGNPGSRYRKRVIELLRGVR